MKWIRADNLTEFEKEILLQIWHSDYHDGAEKIGNPVWGSYDYIGSDKMSASQFRGVMSSLVQKGYVEMGSYERDNDTVAITQKGYEAIKPFIGEQK